MRSIPRLLSLAVALFVLLGLYLVLLKVTEPAEGFLKIVAAWQRGDRLPNSRFVVPTVVPQHSLLIVAGSRTRHLDPPKYNGQRWGALAV